MESEAAVDFNMRPSSRFLTAQRLPVLSPDPSMHSQLHLQESSTDLYEDLQTRAERRDVTTCVCQSLTAALTLYLHPE